MWATFRGFLERTPRAKPWMSWSNLQEVVSMLLEDGEPQLEAEFIGTQSVVVA